MLQLPDPFLPDWQLDPADYPSVFLVDSSWAASSMYKHALRSHRTKALTGHTPLDTPKPTDNHGEKTLQVISALARGLPTENVILVSMDRDNELGNTFQHPSNLPEALMSVQVCLKPGDLVVVNLGSDQGQDSFSSDPLIASLLEDITNLQGGIVVISAGNALQPLFPPLTSHVIIVGGVSSEGLPMSRFGRDLTCYAVVPYNLPELPITYIRPVPFSHSSAATAYVAGMILLMLAYAQSVQVTLTSHQISDMLKTNSITFQVLSGSAAPLASGNLPDWDRVRSTIDRLANFAR